MFRTRRQTRYLGLRGAGLLPFEARPMSRVPSGVPYLKEMVQERWKAYKPLKEGKISEAEYVRRIKVKYQQNRWLRRNRAGRIVADPWQMLRDFEDRWRAKQPIYESPWESRWKRWSDFIAKTEAGLKRRSYLQQE